jgi:hypothetical protein
VTDPENWEPFQTVSAGRDSGGISSEFAHPTSAPRSRHPRRGQPVQAQTYQSHCIDSRAAAGTFGHTEDAWLTLSDFGVNTIPVPLRRNYRRQPTFVEEGSDRDVPINSGSGMEIDGSWSARTTTDVGTSGTAQKPTPETIRNCSLRPQRRWRALPTTEAGRCFTGEHATVYWDVHHADLARPARPLPLSPVSKAIHPDRRR